MLVIRRAVADDLADTSRLLADAFEDLRGDGYSADATHTFDRYLQAITDVQAWIADAELFVAVEAGRVVGAATLYPPRRPAGYAIAGLTPWPVEWAALRKLAVDRGQRGRGIARMLAAVRIERARELGAPVVAMHTSNPAVREMYRRSGWQPCPEYDYVPLPGVRAEAWILALG